MTEWRFRDIRWYTNAGAHTPPEDGVLAQQAQGEGVFAIGEIPVTDKTCFKKR